MALKRWLVGSDGSLHGQSALEVGERLAARHAGVLAQVLVSAPVSPGTRPAPLPASGATPATIRRVGVPGVEIARCAEEWNADVVVLGRGSGGPGQTTTMVLRRCTRPVLMVPATHRPFDRIVFALDGTERGLRILDRGGDFGLTLGAALATVCVVPLHPPPPLTAVPAPRDRHRLVQDAMDQRSDLGGRGGLAVRRGEAVQEILAHLRESGADLLVIGLRQGAPGSDPGSGHVARDLLQVVPTAILTVPI